MKKLNKKGFTIVELVIVIAVIAILAAVMIPTFSGIVEKANKSAVQQKAAAVYKEVYALDLADNGVVDGNIDQDEYVEQGGANLGNDTFTYTSATDFEYKSNGYTAKFNGTAWNVTKP